jgi:hypothetical protein
MMEAAGTSDTVYISYLLFALNFIATSRDVTSQREMGHEQILIALMMEA